MAPRAGLQGAELHTQESPGYRPVLDPRTHQVFAVPALVVAVEDLPRTRSGKLAELAVSDAVNGREVRNTSALANPESLDHIQTVMDQPRSE